MASRTWKFGAIICVVQFVFLILFGVFVEYDESANASAEGNQKAHELGGNNQGNNELKNYYPMFQDVHVMIFIGFGFLMTFLKRYGFGAIGLNFLVSAFVLQWAMLFSGFFHLNDNSKIVISIQSLLGADFAAAAVLITFGALIGKVSPLQLILIAFFEIIFFVLNERVGVGFLQAVDMGGSMFVHTFGAYFGLACARVLYDRDTLDSKKEGSIYHSDLFSMIGTVFLWMYWPSFNAALAPGDDQHRAVINTVLALSASCVIAFAISHLVNKGKFDMVHVQNATLAGGVAVGTSADMMIHPWGAILIGMLAGTLSVVGYKYVTPFLTSKAKLHDTCGVNNLHGMPGVLAGICGAIVTAFAKTETYGNSLYEIYPACAPAANTTELATIQESLPGVEAGLGRSAGLQAGYQVLALVITMTIAIITGALTGLVMKFGFWEKPRAHHIFDDGPFWECPDDFEQDGYRSAIHHPNGRAPEVHDDVDADEDTKPIEDEDKV